MTELYNPKNHLDFDAQVAEMVKEANSGRTECTAGFICSQIRPESGYCAARVILSDTASKEIGPDVNHFASEARKSRAQRETLENALLCPAISLLAPAFGHPDLASNQDTTQE